MKKLCFAALIFLCIACGGKNTESNVAAPGKSKDSKSKTLELGAALIQNKSPLKQMNMYLDGFHFYNGKIPNEGKIKEPLRICLTPVS